MRQSMFRKSIVKSNKLKNKVVPEKKKSVLEKKSGKDAKPRKRLANNVILPESGDPFENIVAGEDEVYKFRLLEPRDYNAEILKLKPKESSHGLDMLTKEVIELRKELIKANENHKALEKKKDLGFNQIKEFVVNSNKQLFEDISLLFAKSDGSSSVIRKARNHITGRHFG
ncbi:hypothetical protein MTR67_048779 [Solanum verrucosum]|uniref:Uncharacterized protein n=1 Tax=Solanum verrucosum TaxID=315347 RepID=A0AAF0V1H3_SOLVR|nr:hypothetical protein MTR67_048779 [Solanum verrucosum]